jgi:hypothetical protein
LTTFTVKRILRAAEPLIGEQSGHSQRDHQEQHERGMADGPGGKIEALHRNSPVRKPLPVLPLSF